MHVVSGGTRESVDRCALEDAAARNRTGPITRERLASAWFVPRMPPCSLGGARFEMYADDVGWVMPLPTASSADEA